jgi:hypothetical protein
MALILLEYAAMDAPNAASAVEAVGSARLLQSSLRLLNGAAEKLELRQTLSGCAHAV